MQQNDRSGAVVPSPGPFSLPGMREAAAARQGGAGFLHLMMPGGFLEEQTASAPKQEAAAPRSNARAVSSGPAQAHSHSAALWPFPRSAPAGYRNLGNTCFLASVLQLLGHTPSLAALAHSKAHSQGCKQPPGSCAQCVLEARIRVTMLAGPGAPQAPQDVLRCMQGVTALQFMTRGRQEDAHECLRLVVEALHHSGLRGMGYPVFGPEAAPGEHRKGTMVEEVFGGQLRSRVTCCTCGAHSDKLDTFEDLSLELTAGTSTVGAALGGFTREEHLDGAERYKCERCSTLSAANKRISVAQAPQVLLLHLKRFKANGWGKNYSHIGFNTTLNLEPYMTPPPAADEPATPAAAGRAASAKYNLFGVVVHSGYGMHSGHYFAYVRDGTGKWYCCDDSLVTVVGEAEVLRCEAYMLAYMREGGTTPKAAAQAALPSSVGEKAAGAPGGAVPIGPPERPSSPAQVVPRSAPLVSWPAIRKRVTSKEDPDVEALLQRCVSRLQCTKPWVEHLKETLRAAKASFQQHHGRPAASVDALVGHWREEKGSKRCFEVLMSPTGGQSALKEHLNDWAADAEQVLRKHARVGLPGDAQNTGQPMTRT
jgi:ubiquitin C-terminal hydrolase